MTKEEIMEAIDRVERAIFTEEMADFMNWERYRELKKKLADLQAQL